LTEDQPKDGDIHRTSPRGAQRPARAVAGLAPQRGLYFEARPHERREVVDAREHVDGRMAPVAT
jgi:hypothetical protein